METKREISKGKGLNRAFFDFNGLVFENNDLELIQW